MIDKNINNLNLDFQQHVRILLHRAKFGEWQSVIVEGYRSVERQNILYARGRGKNKGRVVTYARGGQSDHNYGKAVDLAFSDGQRIIWDTNLYKRTWKIAKPMGFKWGGSWWLFKDNPHFYMKNPKPFADFINKWNFKFLLDVGDHGKLYYVYQGERYYISPDESLEDFAKKFATGFTHEDVLKIPERKL